MRNGRYVHRYSSRWWVKYHRSSHVCALQKYALVSKRWRAKNSWSLLESSWSSVHISRYIYYFWRICLHNKNSAKVAQLSNRLVVVRSVISFPNTKRAITIPLLDRLLIIRLWNISAWIITDYGSMYWNCLEHPSNEMRRRNSKGEKVYSNTKVQAKIDQTSRADLHGLWSCHDVSRSSMFRFSYFFFPLSVDKVDFHSSCMTQNNYFIAFVDLLCFSVTVLWSRFSRSSFDVPAKLQ